MDIERVYEAMAKKSMESYLKFEWQRTPEEALEIAFKVPEIIELFGNLTLETTLEEIANRGAMQQANDVLAKKEKLSPRKHILRENLIKDYNSHLEDYLKPHSKESIEYQTAFAHDLICNGIMPKIGDFRAELVEGSNKGYNAETGETFTVYAIKDWRSFQSDIQRIVFGYVLAHKLGELEGGKSFVIDRGQEPETNGKPLHHVPKTLDEIFLPQYKNNIEEFINLLRETTPPCIDEGLGFNVQYKNKGVFVVWLNALQEKRVVTKIADRKIKAKLLNSKFSNLNISDSIFGQNNKKATDNYKSGFGADIASIITRK